MGQFSMGISMVNVTQSFHFPRWNVICLQITSHHTYYFARFELNYIYPLPSPTPCYDCVEGRCEGRKGMWRILVTGAACCKWGQCRGVWGRPRIRRRSNLQGSRYVLPLFLQNVVFETGRVIDTLGSLFKEGLPVLDDGILCQRSC